MTLPLALVFYEKLLPGSQLVNRLQDTGYRVQTLSEPASLVATAEQTGALLVFADLDGKRQDVLAAIQQLRIHSATSHIPVVAFGPVDDPALEEAARGAGVTLFASETSLTDHLPELLEQALRVD